MVIRKNKEIERISPSCSLTILTLNEVLNQWLGHIVKQLLLGCLYSKYLFE